MAVKTTTTVQRAEELISELETFAFDLGNRAKNLEGNDAQVLQDLSVDISNMAEELRNRIEQFDEDSE